MDVAQETISLLKHYHGQAAEYHRHFSSVRTGALSIAVPIFIVSSIALAGADSVARTGCVGYVLAFLFVLVLFVACLLLNLVFSVWSSNARHIERYYEMKLSEALEAGSVDAGALVGIRELFGPALAATSMPPALALMMGWLAPSQPASGGRRAPPSDFTPAPFRLLDPFTTLFGLSAVLYILFYFVLLVAIASAPPPV